MLREQRSSRAIARTPSPLRAITRISTACSWVNIDGQKTVSFAQMGQICSDAVGQYSTDDDTFGQSLTGRVRALLEYQRRERRFGRVLSAVSS